MKNTIGYIDTSDKIDHKELYARRIFAKVDYIEYKTGKMIQEIHELNDHMRNWQDRKIRDVYFMELLNSYVDVRLS